MNRRYLGNLMQTLEMKPNISRLAAIIRWTPLSKTFIKRLSIANITRDTIIDFDGDPWKTSSKRFENDIRNKQFYQVGS